MRVTNTQKNIFDDLRTTCLNALVATCMLSTLFSNVQAAPVETQDSSVETPWTFAITPYVWAINMQGETQIGNQMSVVNQPFSKILQELDWGGMLWLEAKKDRWGAFINTVYAELNNSGNEGPYTTNIQNKLGLFSGGMSYTAYRYIQDESTLSIDPYVGFRYTLNNATITIPVLNYNLVNDNTWTDPIIGTRLEYDFNQRWQAILAADIGGTNFNTDKSYNINGFVGYTPQSIKNVTFYAGYRLLYQRYEDGSGPNFFLWSMKMFGPSLGVTFKF